MRGQPVPTRPVSSMPIPPGAPTGLACLISSATARCTSSATTLTFRPGWPWPPGPVGRSSATTVPFDGGWKSLPARTAASPPLAKEDGKGLPSFPRVQEHDCTLISEFFVARYLKARCFHPLTIFLVGGSLGNGSLNPFVDFVHPLIIGGQSIELAFGRQFVFDVVEQCIEVGFLVRGGEAEHSTRLQQSIHVFETR